MSGPTCLDCKRPISTQSKKGRCRSCGAKHFNALPETIAKRSESWKRRFAEDPTLKARNARIVQRNFARAMQDPEKLARQRQRAAEMNSKYCQTPEVRAKIDAKRAEAGRKLTEYRLGWCPPEYRDQYKHLVCWKHIPAAEARRMILDEIARKQPKLSPFERQERALERGGKLVANDIKPSLANPGFYGERQCG